jgi:hypothetical protein
MLMDVILAFWGFFYKRGSIKTEKKSKNCGDWVEIPQIIPLKHINFSLIIEK